MSEWCLYGNEIRERFERDLKPEYLLDDLRRYQDFFGEEFGIKELLTIEDLRVKALLAEAINNLPEYLLDQIGKARNSYNFKSVPDALESLVSVIQEYLESVE